MSRIHVKYYVYAMFIIFIMFVYIYLFRGNILICNLYNAKTEINVNVNN